MAAKTWNDDQAMVFTSKMEEEVKTILGDSAFESKSAQQLVSKIVEAAQVKLKAMEMKSYKYVTDVVILPKGAGYSRTTSFWWQSQTDKAITVKVDTEHLACILVTYCVKF